ncbi:hypothetical protein NH340_JMT02413 [Sarcoptes scabiei]|nr:hypothetical protein NH340_JMT02413 [Sarcoptes scabiei]
MECRMFDECKTDDDPHSIIRSSVCITDESKQILIEMIKLGLPTSFTSNKWKHNRARHQTKNSGDQYNDANNITDETKEIEFNQTETSSNSSMDDVQSNDKDVDGNHHPDESSISDNLENDSESCLEAQVENETLVKNLKKHKRKSNRVHRLYWKKRFDLFSLFNEGIKLDKESWYSVTPELIAKHIAERLQDNLIRNNPNKSRFILLDPFCGAGGNVIQFALQPHIEKVIAIDIDSNKIELAKHNASIYGCDHKIEFIVGDFFDIIQHSNCNRIVDVSFFSPPWGGPKYKKKTKFSLNDMSPNGFEILKHASKYLCKNFVMLLPRNFDQTELAIVNEILSKNGQTTFSNKGMIEIEENCYAMAKQATTITMYIGDTIKLN